MTTYPAVSLGKISKRVQYGFTARATDVPSIARYLRISDVDDHGNFITENPVYADAAPEDLEKYKVLHGDLLIARSGVSAGRAFVVPENFNDWIFASYFIRFQTLRTLVVPDYLAAYCRSPFYWQQINRIARGAAQPNVNSIELAGIQVPLPPLSEQRRIVEVLREAEAVRRLRAQADQLTSQLIPALFHEMFAPLLTNRDELKRKFLRELADVQGGIQVTSRRDSIALKRPYLRVANVYRGRLELSEIKEIGLTEAELKRVRIREGDILLVEGHGNLQELGRAAVWDGSIKDCVHQNHLIRVRCNEFLDPVFACSVFNSNWGRHYFQTAGNTTSGLNTISTRIVSRFPMPLVSIELQRRFAELVRRSKNLSDESPSSDSKVQELRSSLLAHAFTGELTEQWRREHRTQLSREASERDAAFRQLGARLQTSRRPRGIEIFDERETWLRTDLSEDQRELLRQIDRSFGGQFPQGGFTARTLAAALDGELEGWSPDAVRRQLDVLAARGLLLAVSRTSPTDTARDYATVYRRTRFGNDDQPSDFCKDEELQRLAREFDEKTSGGAK